MTETTKKNSYLLALVIWGMLSGFYFYQFIARSSFITVLTDQFMRYFDIDATGLGVLGSCYYWVYTLMQIPAGVIVDKFSTKLVATLSALLCSAGLFIFILTPHMWVACIGEMLMGFGSSFAFLLIVKAITQWFPADKIAIMTSFAMSIGCFGPVIGGPLVASITEHFNWIDVMKVYCFVGLGLSVLIWLIVQDKQEESVDNKAKSTNVIQSIKMILSSKQAWVLGLITMAVYAPLSSLGDLWGSMFIKTAYGLSSNSAAIANNMLYLGVVIGSPIIAYIATQIGSYKKPMVCGIIGALSFLSIIVYGSDYLNDVALFIFLFATGFSCGSMLAYPLGLALFPKSVGATVTGFINMMSMVSGVILMPTIGAIMSSVWEGTMIDGAPAYSVNDFRCGLTAVIIFLAFGTILSYFIKDRSPKEQA